MLARQDHGVAQSHAGAYPAAGQDDRSLDQRARLDDTARVQHALAHLSTGRQRSAGDDITGAGQFRAGAGQSSRHASQRQGSRPADEVEMTEQVTLHGADISPVAAYS